MKNTATTDTNFPKFVTLNGADCFFVMLDEKNEQHQLGNNTIRICLLFSDENAANSVEKTLVNSPLIHWMCNIQLVNAKKVFFKPKWEFVDRKNILVVKTHLVDQENFIPQELINRSLDIQNGELIACDRLTYPSGQVALVLSWHHALMDGRGSGFFVRTLLKGEESNNYLFPPKEEEPGLITYIRNMYKVKRFIQHSARRPIGAIRKWSTEANRLPQSKLITHTFTVEETREIDHRAIVSGARFGSGNFLLACCAIAVDRMRKDKGVQGDLWVPVPYDGRKRGGMGPIVSNQIAFLFYRLNQAALLNVKSCVQAIQDQMIDQIKSNMPQKYNMLLGMMRYIPLSLYRFLTTRSSDGRVASFLFSSAGQDKWDLSNMATDSVKRIQLIPPCTVPPGLTFNFLRNDNQLTLNILWSEKVLNNEELLELKDLLIQLISTGDHV